MKITGYELFKVPPRWLFLKVTTDEGITGWGEPIVEGRADTVKAAVTEMMEYLMGKDPMRIEDHWQVLYRGGFYRGGPVLMSAISGIEQALWDIKGKYYGAPVYQLLGGAARDRIRVYCWIGGDRPSDVARAAKEAVASGYTAMKMNATEELACIDTPDKVLRGGRTGCGGARSGGKLHRNRRRLSRARLQEHGQAPHERARSLPAHVYRRTGAPRAQRRFAGDRGGPGAPPSPRASGCTPGGISNGSSPTGMST